MHSRDWFPFSLLSENGSFFLIFFAFCTPKRQENFCLTFPSAKSRRSSHSRSLFNAGFKREEKKLFSLHFFPFSLPFIFGHESVSAESSSAPFITAAAVRTNYRLLHEWKRGRERERERRIRGWFHIWRQAASNRTENENDRLILRMQLLSLIIIT